MFKSGISNGEPDEQATMIIERYGAAAIPHMVDLIQKAVRAGDDAVVQELDQILQLIEEKLAKNP